MKVLVTGANGFVGSFLVKDLLAHGYGVVGVSRNPKIKHSNLDSNFRFIKCDLSRVVLPEQKVDTIIHLSAQARPFGVSLQDYIRDNIVATQNLLDFAKSSRVNKIIYASSLSIYGEIKDTVVDEKTPLINPKPYGLSKYFGELLFEENSNKISSISLRLPGVLGKGARGPWLATVLKKVKENENITIFNQDSLFNTAVYLSGLSGFIISLLERDFTGFNVLTIASDAPMSIFDTVKYLIDQTDSKSKIAVKKSSQISFYISHAKAKNEFGYKPMSMQKLLDTFIRDNSKSNV